MTSTKYYLAITCSLLLYCNEMRTCTCSNCCVDSENYTTGLDITTPRNASLSSFYQRSPAHYTMSIRLPLIITGLLELTDRNKDRIAAEYGGDAQDELETAREELSDLKCELQTSKFLKNLTVNTPDAKFYNDYLAEQAVEHGEPTYSNATFLHGECYTYRRIYEIFEKTDGLKSFDVFRVQKEDSFNQSLANALQLGIYLLDLVHDSDVTKTTKEEFIKLLKLNLWGNKCDLSLFNGVVDLRSFDLFSMVEDLEGSILSDHSEKVWEAVSDSNSTSQIVDIVFDNSGIELYTDLCLADFIISKNLAEKIRFYVKTIPWVVSDVTTHDFHWQINQLKSSGNNTFKELGERWQSYIENNIWTLIEDGFWTLPVDFTYMATVSPHLYKTLAEAKLIFFKGDLNQRKLYGEKNWDSTTSVDVCLQGFNPSKLCTLRTFKCEVICGIREGLLEQVQQKDENWMKNGDYGVIQFSDTVRSIN